MQRLSPTLARVYSALEPKWEEQDRDTALAELERRRNLAEEDLAKLEASGQVPEGWNPRTIRYFEEGYVRQAANKAQSQIIERANELSDPLLKLEDVEAALDQEFKDAFDSLPSTVSSSSHSRALWNQLVEEKRQASLSRLIQQKGSNRVEQNQANYQDEVRALTEQFRDGDYSPQEFIDLVEAVGEEYVSNNKGHLQKGQMTDSITTVMQVVIQQAVAEKDEAGLQRIADVLADREVRGLTRERRQVIVEAIHNEITELEDNQTDVQANKDEAKARQVANWYVNAEIPGWAENRSGVEFEVVNGAIRERLEEAGITNEDLIAGTVGAAWQDIKKRIADFRTAEANADTNPVLYGEMVSQVSQPPQTSGRTYDYWMGVIDAADLSNSEKMRLKAEVTRNYNAYTLTEQQIKSSSNQSNLLGSEASLTSLFAADLRSLTEMADDEGVGELIEKRNKFVGQLRQETYEFSRSLIETEGADPMAVTGKINEFIATRSKELKQEYKDEMRPESVKILAESNARVTNRSGIYEPPTPHLRLPSDFEDADLPRAAELAPIGEMNKKLAEVSKKAGGPTKEDLKYLAQKGTAINKFLDGDSSEIIFKAHATTVGQVILKVEEGGFVAHSIIGFREGVPILGTPQPEVARVARESAFASKAFYGFTLDNLLDRKITAVGQDINMTDAELKQWFNPHSSVLLTPEELLDDAKASQALAAVNAVFREEGVPDLDTFRTQQRILMLKRGIIEPTKQENE